METIDNELFDKWVSDVENEKDFITRAILLKDTYKKGLETKKDRDAFEDIFEYFKTKYEKNKETDLHSLYIYMTKVKGWPDFDYNIYARLLILIGLCGFKFEE